MVAAAQLPAFARTATVPAIVTTAVIAIPAALTGPIVLVLTGVGATIAVAVTPGLTGLITTVVLALTRIGAAVAVAITTGRTSLIAAVVLGLTRIGATIAVAITAGLTGLISLTLTGVGVAVAAALERHGGRSLLRALPLTAIAAIAAITLTVDLGARTSRPPPLALPLRASAVGRGLRLRLGLRLGLRLRLRPTAITAITTPLRSLARRVGHGGLLAAVPAIPLARI
ncbi:MAG: hypothetical protein Q8L66_15770 [Caulobacter sp.]|nr:hypothetical protein [Caulobacter sp.]